MALQPSRRAPARWVPRRRILVTGGGGYLGSILVRELLRRGNEVTVPSASPDAV